MPEDKNKEKVVDTTTSPTEEEIRKQQEAKNQQEVEQLKKDYEQTIADTQGVYDSQINGLADLAGAVDAKIKERQEQDENYRKRENAYRYIAGVGDAISGVANIVGTAYGASNQQQTYNAPALVQKAEESRKARKLEMDNLSNRIDEMRSREKELRSAKDLKTAELRAQQNREVRELKMKQDEIAREDEWKAMQNAINMMNAQANLNRSEASVTNANRPKTTKEHPFDIVGGERIVIPDHKWTDTTIEAVYTLIPLEARTRRARKDRYGLEEKDADGNIMYHEPSKAEKVRDIIEMAKVDETIAKALKSYAGGGTGANNPKYQ